MMCSPAALHSTSLPLSRCCDCPSRAVSPAVLPQPIHQQAVAYKCSLAALPRSSRHVIWQAACKRPQRNALRPNIISCALLSPDGGRTSGEHPTSLAASCGGIPVKSLGMDAKCFAYACRYQCCTAPQQKPWHRRVPAALGEPCGVLGGCGVPHANHQIAVPVAQCATLVAISDRRVLPC